MLIFVLLSGNAWAQGVTLEVQPSAITVLPSYTAVQARVILKNATSATIRQPTLAPWSNDGLKVAFDPPSAQQAAPGEVIVWSVQVKELSTAHLPGSVLFDAMYSSEGGTTQHTFGTLSIHPRVEGTQKPVEASIAGHFDAVSQQRSATGYLLVTNNLDVPVAIEVDPFIPENTFKPPTITPFTVLPHSVMQAPFTLATQPQVTPGTYQILFKVQATWRWGGHAEQRQLVVSKQAITGVFFESELLKALGVPSFLVLPGCLVLFTMQLLLALGVLGLKNESRLPQLTVTSPGFWILAITFSGLFAFCYSLATGSNYLLRYGLEDVRNVWLSSIVTGAVFYLIVALVTRKQRRERVPTSNDRPTDVLSKLSKNGLTILRPEVRFKLSNADLNGFVIERFEDGQTLLWVAPLITAVWESSQAARDAQQRFEQGVNDRIDPDELAQQLREAVQNNYVTVNWQSQASIPGPLHVKAEAITEYRQPGIIISA